MINILATFTVPAENKDAFIAMAKDIIAETRKEAGNISYDLIQGIEDQTNFTFVEKWQDQAAVDAHMASPHFTKLIPDMIKLGSVPPVITLFNPVA